MRMTRITFDDIMATYADLAVAKKRTRDHDTAMKVIADYLWEVITEGNEEK